MARFLGARLLKLDAVLVLLPADTPHQEATGNKRMLRSPALADRTLSRSRSYGNRLSDAVRDIDEGRELLARARHSSSRQFKN